MLQVHKSVSLDRDELLVAYGANPGAVIALLINLTVARDLRGPLPPASNQFWSSKEALLGSLHAAQRLQEQWYAIRGEAKPMKLDDYVKTDATIIASQWLPIGNALPAMVGPLLRGALSNMGDPLSDAAPSKEMEEHIKLLTGTGEDAGPSHAYTRGAWPAGPGSYSINLDGTPLFDGKADPSALQVEYGLAFALIALRLSYPRFRASSYLAGEIDTPNGMDKTVFPLMERAARLATCVKLLLDQPRLLELRSRVRLCLHPLLAPLREGLGSDKREVLESLGARVLAEPMHPWFAEAERVLLPAPRTTRWAAASSTIGLVAQGAFHKLRSETGKGGASMAHRLIGGSMFRSTLKDLQNWALWQLELDEGGRKAGALSTLGFAGARPPAFIHLYGQTFAPIATDGVYASESVGDVLEYLTRTPVALKDAVGTSRLSQPLSLYHYRAPGVTRPDGASPLHMDRHDYWTPGRVPPLFVEPLQPDLDPRGGLGDISPEMVKPVVDSEFWGEADAIQAPYTPEGVAALLALPGGNTSVVEYAGGKARAIRSGFEHLFKISSSGEVTKVHADASLVFYSSRTRRPWLRRVELDRNVVPVLTVAISPTTTPVELPIEAVVAIDEEPVNTSVPIGSVAEGYIDGLLAWAR